MTNNNEDKLTDKQRTNREICNANLRPWKPGQSGNPAGRPPNTKFISDYLRELLDKQGDTGKACACTAIID